MKAYKDTIPVFFAVDDNYAPLLGVALRSLLANADSRYFYRIHVLTAGLSTRNKRRILREVTENATLTFDDVSKEVARIAARLHMRDYYSAATYYRIFIGRLYPEYDRALYLDCDAIFAGDISKMYLTDIGNALLGAVREDVMAMEKVFGDYAKAVVGVPAEEYFNAGILLINLKKYRAMEIEKRFVDLMRERTFTVAQDQDYLNVLCHGKVYYFDPAWNHTAVRGALNDGNEPMIVHYKMDWKPWHHDGVLFAELFWQYADESSFSDTLRAIKKAYTPEEQARDVAARERLIEIARAETAAARRLRAPRGENNKAHYSPKENAMIDEAARAARLAIKEKITCYEKRGWFDLDVEDDPPTTPLLPGQVDYAYKKLRTRVGAFFANRVAKAFFEKKIRQGELVIKAVEGLENYRAVKGGAILTCNHFNPFDNYAVLKAIEKDMPKKALFKIIREGNYTSFEGLYGYFFRHCNTLPLGANLHVMGELAKGVSTLLARGEHILIYPEQGMWWNYKKPRPLKEGAFRFAARNKVPVIPFFISMEDTDKKDAAGFPIQAYTVHIMPAIHPDEDLPLRARVSAMRDRNYELMKAKYEEVYGIPLSYDSGAEGVV